MEISEPRRAFSRQKAMAFISLFISITFLFGSTLYIPSLIRLFVYIAGFAAQIPVPAGSRSHRKAPAAIFAKFNCIFVAAVARCLQLRLLFLTASVRFKNSPTACKPAALWA
jgi:hypothetical protein